jgi:hypothetical protein
VWCKSESVSSGTVELRKDAEPVFEIFSIEKDFVCLVPELKTVTNA